MDREGVGGFLESILAVMVVITASSVFLVVLASGELHVKAAMEEVAVVSWLAENGLYSEQEEVEIERLGEGFGSLGLPEGAAGISLTYRVSGELAPLVTLEGGAPAEGDVLAFQRPLLIDVGGRKVAGVLEVRAWR